MKSARCAGRRKDGGPCNAPAGGSGYCHRHRNPAAPARNVPRPRSSLGLEVVAFVEAYCRVPDGDDVGKLVQLRDFQQGIIRGIYDQPPETRTRTAIISFGKKNAKSSLAAFLLLAHLVGPPSRRNSQLYSTAQTRDQAGLVFDLAAKVVAMDGTLSQDVHIRDSTKTLVGTRTGAIYRALSADAVTAHGISPAFAIHDELGQVRGPTSALWEAVETGMGSHANPLSVVISTQAEDDGDLLSILIDDAPQDPNTRLFLWAADDDDDPYDEGTWRKANPALGDFLSLEEMRIKAARAARLPSRRPKFFNFNLNRRESSETRWITRAMWDENELATLDLDDFAGRPVFCGLDLASTSDLTSLCLVFPGLRSEDPWAAFWRTWVAGDRVEEFGDEWEAPYSTWNDGGWLISSGHAAISFAEVADVIREIDERFELRRIAADPNQFARLEDELQGDFPDRRSEQGGLKIHAGAFNAAREKGELPLELVRSFPQTPHSFEPAIAATETRLLEHGIRLEPSPVSRWCARNCRVKADEHERRKLVKRSGGGRGKRWKIDPIVALVQAIGQADTESSHDPSAGSIAEDADFLAALDRLADRRG